jgi:hypothetical protein
MTAGQRGVAWRVVRRSVVRGPPQEIDEARLMKTDPMPESCRSRWRRIARLTLGALTLASGCSVDSNGLREPPSDAGSGEVHQTGSGGATGTGGLVTGGKGSGGSGPASSGGAGGASGSRPGGGVGAAPSGGASGGTSAGHGGSGLSGTGGGVTGAAGAAASGGATSAGGSTGSIGGVPGSGGLGVAGSAGPPSSGGRGGAPSGVGGMSVPTCGPATCANGCCEGNTCIMARSDARCGKGGAACAACGKCFRCASAGTACEVDPASTWRMTCSSAVLSAMQPDGRPWDMPQNGGPGFPGNGQGPGAGPGPGLGGAELPDPTCQLSFGFRATDASTTVLMNTLTPTWNESITPTPLTAQELMSQAMPWSITVSDDDESITSDVACKVTPELTAAEFAAGAITFTNVQSCTKLTVHLTCTGG